MVLLELPDEIHCRQIWECQSQRRPSLPVSISRCPRCLPVDLSPLPGRVRQTCTRAASPRAYQNLPFTDWMNELQHISEETYGPVLVTLNPPFDPDPETLGGRYEYDHPVLGMKVSLELYAPFHPAVQCFFCRLSVHSRSCPLFRTSGGSPLSAPGRNMDSTRTALPPGSGQPLSSCMRAAQGPQKA